MALSLSTDPLQAAAPVSRISHLSLVTPRLDEMLHHYTVVLGLTVVGGSGSTVHLACSDGTTALELVPGDAPSLDHVGFDIHHGVDLDTAGRALADLGLHAADWTGVSPSGTESLRLVDPDGAVVQVMARKQLYAATSAPHTGVGVQPFKLGHVASRVERLTEVMGFYEQAMGFRFSDSIGDDFVFMRCNADHHAINFLRVGAPRNVHHLAFQLTDWSHIKVAADELWSHGIPLIWGPGRHGAGHNLYTYHRDPDANIVEMFAELDTMSDEGLGVFDWRPWHDGPQYPRRWAPEHVSTNPWGAMPPDRFLF